MHYSTPDGTAVAWDRRLAHRTLTFEDGGVEAGATMLLRDRETGSLGSSLNGKAIAGPLEGAQLEPLSYNPILVDRFRAFYPDGPIHSQ